VLSGGGSAAPQDPRSALLAPVQKLVNSDHCNSGNQTRYDDARTQLSQESDDDADTETRDSSAGV